MATALKLANQEKIRDHELADALDAFAKKAHSAI
jgi:hypothetical protein